MTRWLILLAALGAGVALGAAGLFLLRDDGPEELLPDLDQAAPSRLEIVQVGDTYRLVFASAVANVGLGALVVEGGRADTGTSAMSVTQLVRRTDGTERAREVRGELVFAREETHAHWHLEDFARYELRRARDGMLVGPDEKTGFCLGDRYDATRRARSEGEPERPVWTAECGRDLPGLLTLRQGVSPGYGDDYEPELEGQFVDVTSVPAGRYLLVHRSNPERTLEESDYGNNAASVLLRLRRTAGVIPSVQVLARCAGSDACTR